MGIFTHWYVVVIILAIALLLLSPALLPRLGRRLGRRVRETRDASVEAGKAFKREARHPKNTVEAPGSEGAPPGDNRGAG
jgi:Sec-independent protein translocase protein TatA